MLLHDAGEASRGEGNWILEKSSVGVYVSAYARIMFSCSSC